MTESYENRVDVIIPHYKHQAYLPGAVRSLLGQIECPNIRVLVMNDEPGAMLGYLNAIPGVFMHNYNDENLGQSVRFNMGVAESCLMNSEFVAFQGADDVSMPWRFKLCLRDVGDADIVYTDAVQLCAGTDARQYIKSQPFDIEVLKERNFIVASTVMARTSKVRDVLFDTKLTYGEDWLWYHECYKAGLKFRYIPAPTVYYRDYTSQIGIRYGQTWGINKLLLQERIKELYT